MQLLPSIAWATRPYIQPDNLYRTAACIYPAHAPCWLQIRIEHKGKAKFITPFMGSQLDICKAFGFDVPQGCAPMYMSKKEAEKKRGRPKKQPPIKYLAF